MSRPGPDDAPHLPEPVSSAELDAAREELARFHPWHETARLEVHTTTACPFRCKYCGVVLGEQHASPEVLDRAVDLLLTSSQHELELQFFGGEPLLRRSEVERTIRRGAARAQELGKRLRFVITTSGLLWKPDLLTFLRGYDVGVLYSLDGPADVMTRYRPLARSGADVTAVIEQNLRLLLDSGIDHFVNLVVTPDAAADLPRRLEHVLGLGVRRIQVAYALAPGWTDAAQKVFCEGLRWCAERMAGPEPGLRLQNLGSSAEPTVLSYDLIVDVDGTLYQDAALFGERVLPGLRDACRVGNVFELTHFDGLRRSREENLVRFRRALPDPSSAPRLVLEQQIDLGWQAQNALSAMAPADRLTTTVPTTVPTRARAARVVDRNPLQEKVLRRSLAHQARFIQQRPELLALPLLMLENPCEHDCLFCMAKPLAPTPLAKIERWLADNHTAELNLTRLGIAGNEPLSHPDIDAILGVARDAGFERFEVLTSGAPLADPDRARALYDAGAQAYAIPLHAADPAIHDAITQAPGSHAATVQAIENLRALGATLYVHANLLQQNLDNLAALEALVCDTWGLPLCVLPVRAKAANLPYAELAPRYSEIVQRAGVQCLVAFPLCIASQVQTPALPSGDLLSDVLKVYVLDQPFTKPARCAPCSLRPQCAGTFQAYLELHGDQELEPQ